MAVLDGKYEILSQHAIAAGQMQFDAVAPDGAALRIIWYELETSEETQQFERYRRLLRKLRKGGFAALYDVVSRPGANYIAWYVPETSQWGKPTPDLLELLNTHAYRAELADIRQTKTGQALVYDLAFNPEDPFVPTTKTTPGKLSVETSSDTSTNTWLTRLPPSYLSWGISGLCLIISSLLLIASFRNAVNSGFVKLPDVTGQAVDEAGLELQRLRLNVATEATPSSAPLGTVLSMNPEAGSTLKRYHPVVQLSYAVPANQLALTAVPDLTGLLGHEVKSNLREAKLRLGKTAYTYSEEPVGTVIAQSRAATTRVSEDSVVDILLSEGAEPDLTFVPDLVGMRLEDAQFLLGIAGLAYELDTIQNPAYPAATVLEQTIAPYEPVDVTGAVMRLYINEGEAGSLAGEVIPSFIGLSQEDAELLGRRYNLQYRNIDTAELPAGVVSQTPPPGSPLSAAATGLEITLNVYTLPVAIPVPRVETEVREPEERTLNYAWNIEPGIGESFYTVRVSTAQGEQYIVQQGVTSGGERVEGSLTARLVGPVAFELFLQNQPYSVPLRRN